MALFLWPVSGRIGAMNAIPDHFRHLRAGEMTFTRLDSWALVDILADMWKAGYRMRGLPHADGWLVVCDSRPPIDRATELRYAYGD